MIHGQSDTRQERRAAVAGFYFSTNKVSLGAVTVLTGQNSPGSDDRGSDAFPLFPHARYAQPGLAGCAGNSQLFTIAEANSPRKLVQRAGIDPTHAAVLTKAIPARLIYRKVKGEVNA